MSILAEPRRRQRLSIDPRNLKWKNGLSEFFVNDFPSSFYEGAFGKKMLSKMGWNPGKGLGKKEQGSEENVKLNANYTRKGLGAKINDEETWVEHHDEFAMLLANLNGKKLLNGVENFPKQSESLEMKSKLSRARMHYQNSIRSKDLSQYSEQDKAAILGSFRGKKDRKTKRKGSFDSVNEVDDSKKEDETHFHESEMSVKEYFAEKLKRFKGASAEKKLSSDEKCAES
uniref:G-patch domain-containing protein n=1 Tax=Syphacia muris TaxID=451379 RepID=A0A0N5ABU2_9BILA